MLTYFILRLKILLIVGCCILMIAIKAGGK